jgi:hypothetical protein
LKYNGVGRLVALKIRGAASQKVDCQVFINGSLVVSGGYSGDRYVNAFGDLLSSSAVCMLGFDQSIEIKVKVQTEEYTNHGVSWVLEKY